MREAWWLALLFGKRIHEKSKSWILERRGQKEVDRNEKAKGKEAIKIIVSSNTYPRHQKQRSLNL